MPIAETDRVVPNYVSSIAPKSALRHRPVTSGAEAPSIPVWGSPTPRASRPAQAKQKTRATSCPKPSAKKRRFPIRPGHQRVHWMVPAGLGMAVMVLLALVVQLAWSWGTSLYDNMHYGMPRTTQVDAYVGQETGKTPSHFMALPPLW
jgi:hypothetical protein